MSRHKFNSFAHSWFAKAKLLIVGYLLRGIFGLSPNRKTVSPQKPNKTRPKKMQASLEEDAPSLEPFNPYKKFVCVLIPLWLISRSDISYQAKILYGLLMRHAGENGHCFPGQAKLAEEMGIKGGGKNPIENASRTVRRYLTELIEHKLISVRQPGLNQTNRYTFFLHNWMKIHYADRTNVPAQDGTNPSDPARTILTYRINKQSKNAALSEKEIFARIVMQNDGDQQLLHELLGQYGKDKFLHAAQEVYKKGQILYLSTIRKSLKDIHEKAIDTPSKYKIGNQNIAKQFLQERKSKNSVVT